MADSYSSESSSDEGGRKTEFMPRRSHAKYGRYRSHSARTAPVNVFANDGSFLEMFKKKMQEGTVTDKYHSKMENTEDGDSITPSGSISSGGTNNNSNNNDNNNSNIIPATRVAGNDDNYTIGSHSPGTGEKPAAKAVSTAVPSRPHLSYVGKRRGGKILPTGMVKKVKRGDDEEDRKDAWSQYMAEVKKYKDRSCEDEGKTRPLVK